MEAFEPYNYTEISLFKIKDKGRVVIKYNYGLSQGQKALYKLWIKKEYGKDTNIEITMKKKQLI